VLLVVVAASLPIAAGEGAPREENLLRNPGFDVDLSSWQVLSTIHGEKPGPGGAAVWFPLDAERERGSGSLEIRTSAVSGRDSFAVGQCLEVKRPVDYVIFGGAIRVPPDQPVAGFAYLSVESFALPDCAGSGNGNSTVEPIANADFWSRRIDRVMVRGARSLRLRAIVTKQYEWVEGDDTGQRDDHVPFRALFDGLFLRLAADDTDLPEPSRKPTAGFSEADPVGKTSARFGKLEVDPPRLLLESSRSRQGTREDQVAIYSSNEAISVQVALKHPYRYDDPHRYPIEGLSVAAENLSRGLLGRPTLELVLYRSSDPDRKPLEIALATSGGGGVYDGGSDSFVDVRLVGPSEYRTRAVRKVLDCLYAALRARSTGSAPTPAPTPTDEQLEASPLIAMMPVNPPGDYELVARYQAHAAGFWREPIFSAPLRIRIVEKNFECPGAKLNLP
jgi:hypothetical protein